MNKLFYVAFILTSVITVHSKYLKQFKTRIHTFRVPKDDIKIKLWNDVYKDVSVNSVV